jgi:hypothetical protein
VDCEYLRACREAPLFQDDCAVRSLGRHERISGVIDPRAHGTRNIQITAVVLIVSLLKGREEVLGNGGLEAHLSQVLANSLREGLHSEQLLEHS